MSRIKADSPKGFTLIELLIATLAFSVILLVITTGILQFSRQYYKGVISTRTQDTARSIMDEITRAIQLGNGRVMPLTGGPGHGGYCIGSSRRYSFSRNYQVTSSLPHTAHQGYHGLIVDNKGGCTSSTSAVNAASQSSLGAPTFSPSSDAHELLGEHMRLVNFVIQPVGTTGLYTVDIEVAYGDDDLLCDPNIAGNCNPAGVFPASSTDLHCKSTVGSQFCAVAKLSSDVQARVQ